MLRAHSFRHAPYPAAAARPVMGGSRCDGETPLSHTRLRPDAKRLVPLRWEMGFVLRNSMLVWPDDFALYSTRSEAGRPLRAAKSRRPAARW